MNQFIKKSGGLVKYGLFCAVLACFILLLILPNRQKIIQQDQRIKTLKDDKIKQELLFEFYKELLEQIEKYQTLLGQNETVPEQGCQFNEAIDAIKRLIKKYGFQEEQEKYEFLNIEKEKNKGVFPIQWTMKGEFDNLRPFLAQLYLLPCLDYVEALEVQYTGDTQVVTTKLWIKAMEND